MIDKSNVNCSTYQFGMDEACLTVNSEVNSSLQLFLRSSQCELCDYAKWAKVPPLSSIQLIVNTVYHQQFYFEVDQHDMCHSEFSFEEHGSYEWNIAAKKCSVDVIEKPIYPYLPIFIALVIGLVLAIVWNFGIFIYETILNSEWLANLRARNVPFSELENDLGSPTPTDALPFPARDDVVQSIRRQSRVHSLDVFRGLCLAIMIFVNYGGGKYWFFQHSIWNGLTVADLVFPWFVWIMGVSMAISVRIQLRNALPRRSVLIRVTRRANILILLGIILNTSSSSKTSLENLRFMGVLQRLGISYLIVGTIESLLMPRQGLYAFGRCTIMQDIMESWKQWIAIACLVAFNLGITFLLPVPGCPLGYLGPGGLHDHGKYANCTGGAAGYIDRKFIGSSHMYSRGTFRTMYKPDERFDPEGLLGILTTIFLVHLGLQAGRILQCFNYSLKRISRWLTWALLLGVIAGVLCNFSQNNGVIPVNKNLWSLSFVCVNASFAFLLLVTLYIVIDEKCWWSGAPFNYAGMNSIVLYVGHELTKNMFPWSWQPFTNSHAEQLFMNLWGSAVWMLIAYILHRKEIYITI